MYMIVIIGLLFFKKGPECRTELPQKHRHVACIQFDEDNSITWYFIDGSKRKIAPFKYIPQRNIGDQFMNVNNINSIKYSLII